jgi:hypothetical protein
MGGIVVDPMFAAIEAAKAEKARFLQYQSRSNGNEDEGQRLFERQQDAYTFVLNSSPATIAGLVAKLDYLLAESRDGFQELEDVDPDVLVKQIRDDVAALVYERQ